ncbi:hypothetical protein ACO0LL_13800 [Undibacterium sp. TC4M20W]|uniref:hypothetical protein n=1 Tax=Undibacterium sp. TC4M20W TaxID=3413052 RepID=UPI003BF14F6A
MAQKNEISGDVGQIVMGDSNVGPSLSIVINLNLNNDGEKLLTKVQRDDITKKSKRIVGRVRFDCARYLPRIAK